MMTVMMISVDHDISALLRINIVQFLIQFGVHAFCIGQLRFFYFSCLVRHFKNLLLLLSLVLFVQS